MVLLMRVETTWPTFSFLNGFRVCSAILFPLLGQLALPQDGEDAGAVLLHGTNLLQAVHLSHGHLKLEAEELLLDGTELLLQLARIQISNFLHFHGLLHLAARDELGF